MAIKNANSHPFQVEIVDANDDTFYANSHPYKVAVVGGHIGIEARIVDELPETGETGYIYLVLKEETEGGDIYDEYMWVLQQDGTTYGWEHLGATNEVKIKLYDTEGDNTDGAMTQRAATAMKGKARVLTKADYNYPVDNPDCIALWLLEPGLYLRGDDSPVIRNGKSYTATGQMFMVSKPLGNYKCALAIRGNINASAPHLIYYAMQLDGSSSTNLSILDRYFIVNNLSSSNSDMVLSAAQGKVLKDLIDSLVIKGAGAPTTSTVGTVGQIYEDTTNGKIFVLSEIVEESGQPDEYVWEELGGGVNQISSQDWSDLWQ